MSQLSQEHFLGPHRQPRDEFSSNSDNMDINSIPKPWKDLLGVDAVAVLLPHFTNTVHQLKTQPQLNARSLLWSSGWVCHDSLLLLLLLSAIHFLPRRWPQDINLPYLLIHCHYEGKRPSSSSSTSPRPICGPSVWLILFCHSLSICLSHYSISYFFSTKKKVSSSHLQEDNFLVSATSPAFTLPTK